MTASTPSNLLRIGQLSRQSQVSVKTIRYYEEIGLVQAKKRTEGGFRLFEPETLGRLAFIRRAQALGLTLDEIRQILGLHDRGQRPCPEVRQTLQEKVVAVEHRIEELSLLRQQLLGLLEGAEQLQERPAEICPIIESVGGPAP